MGAGKGGWGGGGWLMGNGGRFDDEGGKGIWGGEGGGEDRAL